MSDNIEDNIEDKIVDKPNRNPNIDYEYIYDYWKPIKDVNNYIEKYCTKNNFEEILEIGPGYDPFKLAKYFVGCNEKIKEYIDLDIDVNKLPFEDKSLDFVYSRHTLEDIQNPDFALKEIIRVSKSGYIETPSPLIEITKGVDNNSKTMDYSGYIHHRYIVWSDIEKCEIYFLPKYNTILDNMMYMNIDKYYYDNKYNWNNYFIWYNDKTPKIIMYKNGVNFGLNNNMAKDYIELVVEAVNKSIQNTQYFISNYMNKI